MDRFMVLGEIVQFVSAIGATQARSEDEAYIAFRSFFRRANYFILRGTGAKPGKFLIVKISRSKTPFWAVHSGLLDLLNRSEFDYFLILLVSSQEGWMFSKKEVTSNIKTQKWKLREADNTYKIHPPLPDSNSFTSPDIFLKRVHQ